MPLKILLCFLFVFPKLAYADGFGSEHILVIDNSTGKVLLEKNANARTPIASLTKLMTAMVVLDSNVNMDEKISIESADVDRLKYSSSYLPVGTALTRRQLLQIALMSSENRAAAALARHHPGGYSRFIAAVKAKLISLGMISTKIVEPTGLSPDNISTAADLVKLATAAMKYEQITSITTDDYDQLKVKHRNVAFYNTNRLVGKQGWNILLSKTGFTNEAGNCLIMQIQLAKKKTTLILLKARAKSSRLRDILNIRRMLESEFRKK